jgi:hypothetical protein
VAALHESGEGLPQGRARDPQLLGQIALGREPVAGGQQPEPDRGAEPLHRLLEGRRRLNRLEDGLERRPAFHR